MSLHFLAAAAGGCVGLGLLLFLATMSRRTTLAKVLAEWRHGREPVTVAELFNVTLRRGLVKSRIPSQRMGASSLARLRVLVEERIRLSELPVTVDTWLLTTLGIAIGSLIAGIMLAVWQGNPFFALLGLAPLALRWIRLSRRATHALDAVTAELPVTIALLGIAAGIRPSFDGEGGALAAVAKRIDAPGLRLLHRAAEVSASRTERGTSAGVESVLDDWGIAYKIAGLRPLARSVAMTRGQGVGLETSLQHLAQDLTDRQIDQVTRRAAGRVVMAYIPFVFLDLPSLVFGIAFPGIVQALAGFGH